MNHYIIDGNNLIGKIKSLSAAKNKQQSREGLVSILNGFFSGKKCNLTLHLDGYANTPLHLSKGKIIYSEKSISDYFILKEIDNSKNKKQIILVSSDYGLIDYAKVNCCSVIKSENFSKQILVKVEADGESFAVKQLEMERKFFIDMFKSK